MVPGSHGYPLLVKQRSYIVRPELASDGTRCSERGFRVGENLLAIPDQCSTDLARSPAPQPLTLLESPETQTIW